MANINVTVTTGLVLSDAPVAPPLESDYVSGDLDLVVTRIPFTVVQNTSRESDALGGTLNIHSEDVTTVMAVQTLVTVREIEAFGGYLKTTDRKFRVARRDLAFLPRSGDKATAGGRTYEVIGVDSATFESAVGIFCRG